MRAKEWPVAIWTYEDVEAYAAHVTAPLIEFCEHFSSCPHAHGQYIPKCTCGLNAALAAVRADLQQGQSIPCAGCGKPSGSFGEPKPNTIYRCIKCDD